MLSTSVVRRVEAAPYVVVLVGGTVVRTIAEHFDSARDALRFARELNEMMDGTAVYSAVVPGRSPRVSKASAPRVNGGAA